MWAQHHGNTAALQALMHWTLICSQCSTINRDKISSKYARVKVLLTNIQRQIMYMVIYILFESGVSNYNYFAYYLVHFGLVLDCVKIKISLTWDSLKKKTNMEPILRNNVKSIIFIEYSVVSWGGGWESGGWCVLMVLYRTLQQCFLIKKFSVEKKKLWES